MTCRILLTGGSGQLGAELLLLAWPTGWAIDAPSRRELDLRDSSALQRRVTAGGYAAVINAAAFTQVDAAQNDAVVAWQANALAPAALSAGAAEAGIPMVQISTDYVFPGTGKHHWQPQDAIAPLSVYGASKAGGELAVKSSGARYAILRTAWVVSAQGQNFVRTMLKLANVREQLGVVADQQGTPTAAADLAVAVRAVVERLIADPNLGSGTWHVANAGEATWFELAEHVFAEGARRGHPRPRVVPLTTAEYPTPAPRPANSRLDTRSFRDDFDLALPPWREAVGRIVGEIIAKEYR